MHLFCSTNQHLSPFYSWIIFHSMDGPHFCLSTHQTWMFGLFPLFCYEQCCYEYICTCFGVGILFSTLWVDWSEIVGSCDNSMFYFWGVSGLFSTVATPFAVPAAVYEGSNFSTSSPSLVIIYLFDSTHPNRWEIAHHFWNYTLPVSWKTSATLPGIFHAPCHLSLSIILQSNYFYSPSSTTNTERVNRSVLGHSSQAHRPITIAVCLPLTSCKMGVIMKIATQCDAKMGWNNTLKCLMFPPSLMH